MNIVLSMCQGLILSTKYFYIFSHLLLPTTLGGGSYHIHFTDKETGTSHMAGMWQSHDLNPECSPESVFFSAMPQLDSY